MCDIPKLADLHKVYLDAEKALEAAANATPPDFDPDLGMTREEFDQMIQGMTRTSIETRDKYSAKLKEYEIGL